MNITAKQVTPTDGNEAPLVSTGAEFIIPQISSSRFVHKAKKDGKIVEVDPNKTLTVKYKDGSQEIFDILPRMSRTKMGINVLVEMNTLEVGKRFKKDQVLAFSKNFNNKGIYCSGKNVFMAMMNYDGMSHEDSYVISDQISNSMTRDIVKEVSIVIPPQTKILSMVKEKGKNVTTNDVLVEFIYPDEIDHYLELTDMDQLDEEQVISTLSKGQDSIKLMAQDGEIVDIKVFVNNKNSIDKQVSRYHSEMVKDTRAVIAKLSKNAKSDADKIKSIDNMSLKFMKTGGHKLKGGAEYLGAQIVYYIKQKKPLLEGDKFAGRFGNKGIIGKVITKENTPKPEFSPKVDVFISPIGVFSRKNISMIKELYLGKIMYFLNQKVVEMANNSKYKTDEIIKLILDIYGVLGSEKVIKSVSKNLDSMSPTTIRRRFKNNDLKLAFTVIPFTTVSFDQIKTAADHLNIPLDEKIYFPELDIWTKNAVPVGVTYGQALEQTSEIYANIRSSGKYQGLTGQATKGKQNVIIIQFY